MTSKQQHRKRTRRALTALVVLGLAMVPVAIAQVGSGSGTVGGDAGADSTIDGTTDATGSATGDATGSATGDVTGDVTGDASGSLTGDATTDVASSFDTGSDVSSDIQLDAETRTEAQADAVIGASMDASAKAQAEAEATAAGMFGFFDVQGEAYTGTFAQLKMATDQAAVIDHSVRADGDAEARFINELSIDGDIQERLDGDAEAHVWTDNAHLKASDDAAATILVEAESQTQVALDLAAEAQADANQKILWLEAEGREGAIAILGEGSFQADAEGNLYAALAAGSQLRFEADDGSSDWQAEQAAYADGRVGAEAAIATVADASADAQAEGEAAAEAALAYKQEYSVDLDVLAASDSEVLVRVSSDEPQPRVVRFEIEDELAAAIAADSELEMTMDGQAMTRLASAADVYAETESAAYAIIEAEGHTEVVANVDSFSSHDLRLQSAGHSEAENVNTPVPVIVVALGLIVAALKRRH